MISVSGRIYMSGILGHMKEPPMLEMWSFCPAKGEIDSAAGKMERQTCMNCCIRNNIYSPNSSSFLV